MSDEKPYVCYDCMKSTSGKCTLHSYQSVIYSAGNAAQTYCLSCAELQAKLKSLEKDHEEDWKRIQDAERKCAQIEAENKRLRDALEFYADKKNWYRNECEGDTELFKNGPNEFDDWIGGKRAREALKEGDK